eukprot:Sro2_g001250.2  (983) ;mRNA; f:70935-73883
MSPEDGIVSIPIVAHARADMVSSTTLARHSLGGYAYEYRYVSDDVEFGWMELNLQCGCSRPHESKVMRRGNLPPSSIDKQVAEDEDEVDESYPPPPPPPQKICRTAMAFASAKPDLARPLENFGYDLWGYTNGPFASSYSFIVLDLLATVDGEIAVEEGEPQQVGTVKVFFDGEDADVTFTLDDSFPLQSTLLYVGKDPLPVHNRNADKSQVSSASAFLDFPYQHGEDKFVDAPYTDSYTVEGFDYGDTIYVMALAKDCTDVFASDDRDSGNYTASFLPGQACLRAESECFPLTAHDTADTVVGQACFSLDKAQEHLNVRYSLDDGWALAEAQVWVGSALQSMPMRRDKSPDLRSFEYQRMWYKKTQTWFTQVPLERKERCAGSKHGDFDLVVVAHALVGSPCGPDDKCGNSPVKQGSEQHVYAEETLLQKKDKWFYYVDMRLDCKCDEDEAIGFETLDDPTSAPTAAPTSSPTLRPTVSAAPSDSPSDVSMTPKTSPSPTQAPTILVDMKNTCMYTEDGSGEYCLALHAPHAWETTAGSVCLTLVEGELVVMYDVVGYWSLAEASIWVGSDLFDVPVNNDQEPDTESFPFRRRWPQGSDTFTDVIPLDEMTQAKCQSQGAYNLYVVAHGLVAEPAVSPTPKQPFVPYSEEDAFAKAYPFSDSANAYYVLASVICDCAAYKVKDDGDGDGEKRRSLEELKDIIHAPTTFEVSPMHSAPGYVNTPSKSPAMVVDDALPAGGEMETNKPNLTSRDNTTPPQKDSPLETQLLPASTSISPSVIEQEDENPMLQCRDAWALDETLDAVCFPRIHRNYTYGWSNGPLRLTGGILILDLYLDTLGDCSRRGENVGTVWVSWDNETSEISVDFKVDNDSYYATQTHLYMGPDPLYWEKDVSAEPVLDPKKFPLQHGNLTSSLEDTHIIRVASIQDRASAQQPSLEDMKFLSAHVTVCTTEVEDAGTSQEEGSPTPLETTVSSSVETASA